MCTSRAVASQTRHDKHRRLSAPDGVDGQEARMSPRAAKVVTPTVAIFGVAP